MLLLDRKTHTSTEEVAGAFSEHFQRLATPTENPDYDEQYKEQVSVDKLWIELLAIEENVQLKPVTPKKIMNIIKSFKSNKAQDAFGISAEHLKFAPESLYRVLAFLMNTILSNGYVPPQLKQDVLIPVLKKKGCYSPNKLSWNYSSVHYRKSLRASSPESHLRTD